MTDKSSLIFEIADTFGLEVSLRRGPPAGAMSGSAKLAWPVMQGLNWQIEPKIADSGYYEGSEKAGALLRVTGALYLLLLIDGAGADEEYARLWVLDGAKLGWRASTNPMVFPVLWKRALLYAAIQEGVVAEFRRKRKAVRWVAVEGAQRSMREYVQAKKAASDGTETAAEKVVKRLMKTDLNTLSSMYRTIGPRGV